MISQSNESLRTMMFIVYYSVYHNDVHNIKLNLCLMNVQRFDAMCEIRVNNKGGIQYTDRKLERHYRID